MAQASGNREFVRYTVMGAVCLAAVAGILALQPGSVALGALPPIRLQFDLDPLWRTSTLVQVHVLTVFYALATGPLQFALPKGTRLHRMLGWSWVLAMAVTAVTSLFIRDINDGRFSPIHLFSVWTLISLPIAVWLARIGHIRSHRATLIGLYIGLVIAGLLSIAPGRVVWDMFFG